MQEKVSIMCSWYGWENPSLGLRAARQASLVTAYAALRPRNGFSHPHQEHMKDTYISTSLKRCETQVSLKQMSIRGKVIDIRKTDSQ